MAIAGADAAAQGSAYNTFSFIVPGAEQGAALPYCRAGLSSTAKVQTCQAACGHASTTCVFTFVPGETGTAWLHACSDLMFLFAGRGVATSSVSNLQRETAPRSC